MCRHEGRGIRVTLKQLLKIFVTRVNGQLAEHTGKLDFREHSIFVVVSL